MRKLEEKFRENTTLKYYNENATIFSATTQIVDFSITQDKFLALLQPNAYILDFGCGLVVIQSILWNMDIEWKQRMVQKSCAN